MAKILPKRSSTGGSAPGTDDLADGEIAINYADKKIYGRSGGSIVVLSEPGGGNAPSPADSYSEPVFTGGVLTSLTIWMDSSKGAKVSSKTFSYTSGNLTSVVEKDGSDVTTLTKTLSYDGDGNLASITKDYA